MTMSTHGLALCHCLQKGPALSPDLVVGSSLASLIKDWTTFLSEPSLIRKMTDTPFPVT